MRKWLSYSVLFMLVYVVFLLATLPAKLLLSYVKLPANVQVIGVSGTIWHTNIEQLSTPQVKVNAIHANLSISSLLRVKPSIDLNFGGGLVDGPEGSARVSGLLHALTVSDANISIPAQTIAQQLVLPVEVNAQGLVQLKLAKFVIGEPVCQQLTGQLIWQSAGVDAYEQSITLGNLSAQLTCQQGMLVAKVNANNVLGLTFTAYLRNTNQLTGNGYLKPAASFPTPLQQILPFLGNPDRQGRYRLTLP